MYICGQDQLCSKKGSYFSTPLPPPQPHILVISADLSVHSASVYLAVVYVIKTQSIHICDCGTFGCFDEHLSSALPISTDDVYI